MEGFESVGDLDVNADEDDWLNELGQEFGDNGSQMDEDFNQMDTHHVSLPPTVSSPRNSSPALVGSYRDMRPNPRYESPTAAVSYRAMGPNPRFMSPAPASSRRGFGMSPSRFISPPPPASYPTDLRQRISLIPAPGYSHLDLDWGTEHPLYHQRQAHGEGVRIPYTEDEESWILRVFNRISAKKHRKATPHEVFQDIITDEAAIPVFHQKHVSNVGKIKDKMTSLARDKRSK
jgi:hypothetical protein